MNKPLQLSAILLLLTLSACGWQLRGTGSETTIERLYLETNTPNSLFTQVLRQYLLGSGIELTSKASEAEYSLNILKEKSTRRTATVSASARISERLLKEHVEYIVLNPDRTAALERATVIVERIFEYNENNVLATEDEAQILKSEMYGDLARQLVNRLRHLKKPAQSSDAPAS